MRCLPHGPSDCALEAWLDHAQRERVTREQDDTWRIEIGLLQSRNGVFYIDFEECTDLIKGTSKSAL